MNSKCLHSNNHYQPLEWLIIVIEGCYVVQVSTDTCIVKMIMMMKIIIIIIIVWHAVAQWLRHYS
jgi:hypothetical protein